VLANMVMGIDGSATLNGRAGDLSDATDQLLFGFLRTLVDAVLVGARTVRVEQYGPVTNESESGESTMPPRMVIVTASGDLDFDSTLFAASDIAPLILTTTEIRDATAQRAGSRAEVIAVGEHSVDIPAALRVLRHNGIERLLTEGGPTTLSELVRADSVDELCMTIAPVVGSGQRRVFEDAPAGRTMRLAHSVPHDDRIFCRYLFH